MKKINLFITFLFSISIIPIGLSGQVEMNNRKTQNLPDFHYDAVNVMAPGQPDKSRLNIFLKIAYDELQFLKKEGNYQARYEVTAALLDKSGDQVDGKIWDQTIQVQNFDETNKPDVYDLTNSFMDVSPGNYKLSIGIIDMETGARQTKTRELSLRDFYKEKLALSDISFVSNVEVDSLGIKSIYPEVTDADKTVTDKLFAYFEIYSFLPGETVEVHYKIIDLNKKVQYENHYTRRKTSPRTLDYIPIELDSLGPQKYIFELTIQENEKKVSEKKLFNSRWSELPESADDIDEAIEQIRYYANRQEWKKLKGARDEEKLKVFNEYWEQHDPTPGTPQNETKEEYYQRVAVANSNFTVLNRHGWRTDMGMLYIILGPPDDIEREAYPRGSKPYQIWYYYRYNRRFIFVDHVGFGEYRLETPISIYEIQRIR